MIEVRWGSTSTKSGVGDGLNEDSCWTDGVVACGVVCNGIAGVVGVRIVVTDALVIVDVVLGWRVRAGNRVGRPDKADKVVVRPVPIASSSVVELAGVEGPVVCSVTTLLGIEVGGAAVVGVVSFCGIVAFEETFAA